MLMLGESLYGKPDEVAPCQRNAEAVVSTRDVQ
jgi:hypothetical protein